MVSNGQLNTCALIELKPTHEARLGVKLIANNTYGLCVYQNYIWHITYREHEYESSDYECQ